jgi:hypothetical protein
MTANSANGKTLKSLENVEMDKAVYVRLHTAAQEAVGSMESFNAAMSSSPHMHAVSNSANSNSINLGGLSGGSSSFTFIPNGSFTSGGPVSPSDKVGFWMVGGREISTVSLLLLVEEWFKKQDRIANPPKFDTPEAAQEWLDSVS